MANKVSSAPLFGAPTARQVEDIQKHMKAFADKLAKDPDKLRKVLEATGAVASKPSAAQKT